MAGWKFFLNGIEVAEPIGWDAIEFTAKRLPSHGIDSPFSTELTFTGKAAKLIKAEYEAHYINAEIAILIQSNVKVNGSDYAFAGFLNLSIYTEKNVCDTNGWEITVGIIEDNFRERFLSRQGVEIDLLAAKDLDENVITPVVLDTIVTHSQELFLQADAIQFDPRTYTSIAGEPVFLVFWRTSDFKGVFGNTFDISGDFVSNTNVIFVNNADATREMLFSGRAVVSVRNNHPFNTNRAYVTIGQYDSSGGATGIFTTVFATPNINPLSTYLIDYTFTQIPITVQAGYRVSYFLSLDVSPIYGYNITFADTNTLRLEEFNSTTASLTNGLMVFKALQTAIYLMTGDPDGLVSDVLTNPDGCFWNNLITTGLLIRNATPVEGIQFPIKTSFEKLFEGLDRILCLGWQFEQDTYGAWKLRVEKADYFYNNTEVVQSFFKVGQIVQNAMSDKLVNNVKLGYSDKFKNIAVSALTEINADRNYFIANKARIDNSSVSLDIRSDIIASGYAIEFYRRLQFLREDSGSSDRPNDYDLFIIWTNRYEITVDLDTEPGIGYRLEGETGSKTFAPGTVSYGSNFIAESNGPIDRVYNVYHSPARIACRWWKFLGMHTFGLPTANAILAYQVGQYFTDYSSRIDSTSEPDECMEVANGASDVLSESTNIGPDILTVAAQDYLMKPISVEFDVPQSLCSFIDMSYNGNGLVRVTSGSLDIYGFIQESGNKPQDPNSGLSTIKLIMSKTGLVNGDYKAFDYDSDDYFTG
jgi:hypothetical protein